MSSTCQSDHLGRLLGQCEHRMRMVMDRSLRQYGVTPAQCRALMYLHRQPEPVTQRQLEQYRDSYETSFDRFVDTAWGVQLQQRAEEMTRYGIALLDGALDEMQGLPDVLEKLVASIDKFYG